MSQTFHGGASFPGPTIPVFSLQCAASSVVASCDKQVDSWFHWPGAEDPFLAPVRHCQVLAAQMALLEHRSSSNSLKRGFYNCCLFQALATALCFWCWCCHPLRVPTKHNAPWCHFPVAVPTYQGAIQLNHLDHPSLRHMSALLPAPKRKMPLSLLFPKPLQFLTPH